MPSENSSQSATRLAIAQAGLYVWRNNVGACVDSYGRSVRYGLANESEKINRQIKSSDLIGIHPVVITPEHLGQTMGLFWSIEMKKPGWKYTGNEREQAQKRWIDLINSLGGIAQFATGPDDLKWK